MKVACENEMWTEKYKPKSALQLIGNSKNVEKLKSWLQMLNNDLKKGLYDTSRKKKKYLM